MSLDSFIPTFWSGDQTGMFSPEFDGDRGQSEKPAKFGWGASWEQELSIPCLKPNRDLQKSKAGQGLE
jgi:hypothetical protein